MDSGTTGIPLPSTDTFSSPVNHFHLIPPRCCALLAFSAIVPIVTLSMNGAEIGAGSPPKPAKPSPLTGKEERATFSLPPGFEIELVAEESAGVGKFVPLAFDQKGRLWTTTAFEYPVDADVRHALNDFIKEHHCDMLVMIPHKYEWIERLFRKSETKNMIFHTHIPLLVLPEISIKHMVLEKAFNSKDHS